MKEYKQFGSYGLIFEDNKILLIKKYGGPYDGKFDLPGGTIEFCERPVDALKRELQEEVGIEIQEFDLFDADSVSFEWNYKEDTIIKVQHTGIFYIIKKYKNDISKEMQIDDKNDDSLGADFYDISKLSKKDLSNIAILVLTKLGYNFE